MLPLLHNIVLFLSCHGISILGYYHINHIKLYDLFHFKLLIFVYESVHLISLVFFHNFFETLSSVHQYDTRQGCKGYIFMTRKNTLQYGLRSIRFAGAKSWNNIPSSIKQSTTIMTFRRDLNPISTGRFFTYFVLGGGLFRPPPSCSPKPLKI